MASVPDPKQAQEPLPRVKTYITPKSTLKIPTHEQLESMAEELHGSLQEARISNDEVQAEKVHVKADVEKVVKAWADFAALRKENVSEYTALNRDILWDELHANVIVQFESELLLTNFNKLKPDLIKYFKDKFGFTDFDITTEVIEQPESQSKPLYTNRDKYEHLAKQNPILQEFVKRLGLELE